MKIMTKYEFSGVPKGTTGLVIDEERDKYGKIKEYAIQWDLERPKPLVDWFTVDEFRDYLEVIG